MQLKILQEGVRIAISDNELRSVGSDGPPQVVGVDGPAVDACEVILQELPTPTTLAVRKSRFFPCRSLHVIVPPASLQRMCIRIWPVIDSIM